MGVSTIPFFFQKSDQGTPYIDVLLLEIQKFSTVICVTVGIKQAIFIPLILKLQGKSILSGKLKTCEIMNILQC